MIRIIDVCKVLCHVCGNYLEGVSAVFDNRVARLCWQDFQIRAMKRGGHTQRPCCLETIGPSRPPTTGDCPNQSGVNVCISDTKSHSETTTSSGGSHTEGVGYSAGGDHQGYARHGATETLTDRMYFSLSDQLVWTRELLRRLKPGYAFVRVKESGFIDGEGI